MPPTPPFDLTQIEIDNLPEKWQDWHLENSSLARTWSETLNEAVLDNQIKPELAHKLLHALRPATVKAWAEQTWGIPEVQMQARNPFPSPHPFLCHFPFFSRTFEDHSGPLVSYNRNDDIYKFVLENVILTLPTGEPNPMDGYIAPPPGRGKLNNPYDLTGDADDDEEGDDGVTNMDGNLDALQLASSPPAPITPTKRTYSTMAASGSTSITASPSAGCRPSSSKPAKSNAPKPLIITIPRLTIILYPSGFYKHHDALPSKDRKSLREAAKQFDKEKMEEMGLKKVVKRRVARGPRKKAKFAAKTGEMVDRRDLDEDEVGEATLVEEVDAGPAPQEEQQDEVEVKVAGNLGYLVELWEGESE